MLLIEVVELAQLVYGRYSLDSIISLGLVGTVSNENKLALQLNGSTFSAENALSILTGVKQ